MSRKHGIRRMVTCIAVAAGLIAMEATAQNRDQYASPLSPAFYYEMNGGEAVRDALNPEARPQDIQLGAAFRLPTSCDIWEKRESIGDYVGGLVKDYVKRKVVNGLISKVIGAVEVPDDMLEVASLERTMPGMYDWMTNMYASIEEEAAVSVASCKDAVARLDAGASPLDPWLNISTSNAWRNTLTEDYENGQSGGADWISTNVNAVAADMNETAKNTSIQWFGDQRGADRDKPIKVTSDVVSAGYAAAVSSEYSGTVIGPPADLPVESAVAVNSSSSRTVETRLKVLFPSSDDAAAFGVQVLGEESVTYCDDCPATFTPGAGLKVSFADEKARLTDAWQVLLSNYPAYDNAVNATVARNSPKINEFDDVSSQTTRITKQLYNAIREMPEQDRRIVIGRLISDVAVENTVEKGMALRQLISSGMMTPDVQAYDLTREKAQRLADMAMNAVNEFIWEIDINRQLASNTASTILRVQAVRDSVSTALSPGDVGPTGGVDVFNGEVQQRSVTSSGSGSGSNSNETPGGPDPASPAGSFNGEPGNR